MKAAFLPKYRISGEVLIERSLPCLGTIFAIKGNVVQAFDKIGEGKMLLEESTFKFEGDLLKKRGDFVSQGESVSKGKKSFGIEITTKSPATGYLVKVDSQEQQITIRKPSRVFDLIAGVPGFITAVADGRSVLITTRAVVAKGIYGAGIEAGGELVIVGDGKDSIGQEDLSENLAGKIVVCGRISREVYAKGVVIRVAGFVCGSANFSSAKSFKLDGPEILVMEGFGEIELSPILFSYLKSVAGRFVVLRACENELIIPEPDAQTWCFMSCPLFVDIKVGQTAQILSYNNFGNFGKVESVDEKKGTVKISLLDKKEVVEVRGENVGIITS